MFGLIRRWRRRRAMRGAFPGSWQRHLDAHVPFVAELSADEQACFRRLLLAFVAEKHFIAAGGMQITEEVKVVIAAAAVRLVLHLDLGYYDRLSEIVVYPSHFRHPEDDRDDVTYGEAHAWGTVVLSYDAVLHGLHNTRDGHDTATHEFAHVLDRAGGAFDGTPELRRLDHYRPWAEVMSRHYTALRGRKRKQRRVLRSYGAQNEAEFFAVATEAFFEKPQQMREHTPDLYQELSRFYGFDPLAEKSPPGATASPRRS